MRGSSGPDEAAHWKAFYDAWGEWVDLEQELRYENRHFPKKTGIADRAAALVRDVGSYTLPAGALFSRCRIPEPGLNPEEPTPTLVGPPPLGRGSSGRANSLGVATLYAANPPLIAASEVRVWPGAQVWIAEYRVMGDLKLANLSWLFDDTAGPGDPVLRATASLFSRPIDPRDPLAYVAAQYFSDRLRSEGYSGIVYRSVFDHLGLNFAIFPLGQQSLSLKGVALWDLPTGGHLLRQPDPVMTWRAVEMGTEQGSDFRLIQTPDLPDRPEKPEADHAG